MANLIDKQEAIDTAKFYETFCDPFPRVLESLEALPPAEIRINLNEFVKVKLTDKGQDIFYHRFDGVNECYGREICKPEYPEIDEDGYTSFQLWQFISLYGEHIGMAKAPVICPLEIVYGGER